MSKEASPPHAVNLAAMYIYIGEGSASSYCHFPCECYSYLRGQVVLLMENCVMHF